MLGFSGIMHWPLRNTSSLSYTDLPNIDILHYYFLKLHTFITTKLSEKSLSTGKLSNSQSDSSFLKFLFSLESLNFTTDNKHCPLFHLKWQVHFTFKKTPCVTPNFEYPWFVKENGAPWNIQLVELVTQSQEYSSLEKHHTDTRQKYSICTCPFITWTIKKMCTQGLDLVSSTASPGRSFLLRVECV